MLLWMEGDICKECGEFECVASGVAVSYSEKMKREGMWAFVWWMYGYGGEDVYFIVCGLDNIMGMGIVDGVYLWCW